MNDGTPSASSDSEMASKIRKIFVKIFHATFDKKIKINCLYLIMDDDEIFKNKSKKTYLLLRTFLTMLNL